MLDQAHSFVHALNDITPLGLCAGLGFIIYQLVSKNGWAHTLTDNHLSDLPMVVKGLDEIKALLMEMNADLAYIKGRLNGKG